MNFESTILPWLSMHGWRTTTHHSHTLPSGNADPEPDPSGTEFQTNREQRWYNEIASIFLVNTPCLFTPRFRKLTMFAEKLTRFHHNRTKKLGALRDLPFCTGLPSVAILGWFGGETLSVSRQTLAISAKISSRLPPPRSGVWNGRGVYDRNGRYLTRPCKIVCKNEWARKKNNIIFKVFLTSNLTLLKKKL